MSSQQHEPKITSKNLAYSSDLPPFLAKLRGQHQQQRDSDSPDPILAARRRAARPRSASEEAEDAPLVVDEAGNTVALPSGADADVSADDDVDGRNDGASVDNAKEREKEKIAGIGAGKKRKVGRVVGGTDEDGVQDEERKPLRNIKGQEKEESSSAKNSNKPAVDAKSGTKHNKKKAKKIKLSFNDDGD
ncbi:hypothetical protein F4815DRAFT_476557 [Daldinia loculata]|nr:hypothetical protein F4815DRAFT_476557 [Daldinia loculata]